MSTNIMEIEPMSGLNSDGFIVRIIDEENIEQFNKEYRYGWTASYDKRWADDKKPYVTDIIKDLIEQYGIESKQDIKYRAGKNVFSGGTISDDDVSRFISNYLNDL